MIRTGSTDKKVCPKCGGSGWEIYTVSKFCLTDVYGDEAFDCDYGKKCTECNSFAEKNADLTGVPEVFREAGIYKFDWECYGTDMEKRKQIAFSFFKDFLMWNGEGKGLYIYSKTPGSGKTFLACCLGKSVMMKYQIRFKFITAPQYLDKVSEGYTLAKQGVMNSPAEIYKECELLVIDDIGTQIEKEWQEQELFKLLNTRLTNNLPTIFTSNYLPEQLKVNDRIKSRIATMTIPLPLPEVSIRDIKAKETQNKFVERIFKEE